MNVYAIYDRVAGDYSCISLAANDNIYKRSLSAMANDPNPDNLFSSHSADYSLYRLGSFDVKTGDIVSDKEFICNASELKEN